MTKSYYETEGKGLDYIADENNLKKITNKSLCNFLKYYQTLELSPYITDDITTERLDEIQSYKGAKDILSSIKKEKITEIFNKLIPEIRSQGVLYDKDIKYSRRTVYNYMNAMKYIRAVGKAKSELHNELITAITNQISASHK